MTRPDLTVSGPPAPPVFDGAASRDRPYLQPDVETASRQQIDQWQQESLPEAIDFALARSPFISDLWAAAGVTASDVRTTEQLRLRAPAFTQSDVTRRAAATADPFGGLLSLDRSEISLIAATSGTTGVPLALPQYPGNPRSVATSRDLWDEGLRPGDTVVRMSTAARTGFQYPGDDLLAELGVMTVKLDGHPSNAPALIAACRQFGPVGMSIMTRPLLMEMEALATAQGFDLAQALQSFRSVTFGGETLDTALRDRLTSLFGRVRSQTSLGNTIAAVECRQGDGGHTWEDLVHVEVRDPDTHELVADGEIGELIVTTLQERAMPLLRFRTEDLVRYTSQRCGCGRTHGRIWTLGRLGDGVSIAGKTVLPATLFPVVGRVEEARDGIFQFIVEDDGSVALRVGCRVGRDSDVVRRELTQHVGEFLGVDCPVTMVDPDDIIKTGSGIKFPRIVRR